MKLIILLNFQLCILGQSVGQVRPSTGSPPVRNLPFRVRNPQRFRSEFHMDSSPTISSRLQYRLRPTVRHTFR